MPTKLRDTNVAVSSARSALRLVPAKRPTVLIVEDYEDAREMLRTLLEMENCRVAEACNGLEAVEMAIRLQPDVILMDGSLPLMDGLEATRRIRQHPSLRQVLILAMDGWGTPVYRAAALAAGCNDSLVKPIDFERLEEFLRPFLKQSGGDDLKCFAGS
jgi:CheY-like chemotaxis protein